MALTEEQLVLQMDILASKTDSTTNPNMPFKTNATLNKGLNPTYFSGNYTKIVNALNQLATNTETSKNTATNVLNKVNEVLLDTDSSNGAVIWENVKVLMGKNTVLEGIESILSGEKQQQILNLSADDIGKILMVAEDEDGNLITSTIEVAGLGEAVVAEEVVYSNADRPEFPNVKSVLDYILENEGNFGGGESGGASSIVDWIDIINKPTIPSNLTLTETSLNLCSGEEQISSVEIVTDADIDAIISEL